MKIGTLDDGVLLIDGVSIERLPRSAEWTNATVYLVAGSLADVARAYLSAGDRVVAARPGQVGGIDVRTSNGWYTIRSGDVWGLPDDPERARAELAELRAGVESTGRGWAPTAGSFARRIGRTVLPWLGHKRRGERMLSRARFGSRWSITPGPMVCCRGGAPRAQQVDIRGAYLEGIRNGRVWSRTWPIRPGTPWPEIRERDGWVAALVEVPSRLHVGPVPVRRPFVTTWPTGLVITYAATWTLRVAEIAAGLRVVHVLDGGIGHGEPRELRPMADALDDLSRLGDVGKRLRKLAYTRWWAGWASEGWYSATIETRAPITQSAWSKLRWVRDHVPDRMQRPDVSLEISARAWAPMVSLLVAHGKDVVAAHVDAIWTEQVAEVPPGWALKGDGPLRCYGIGVYEHAGRIAAMGCPPWVRGRKEIQKWARRGHGYGTAMARRWTATETKHGASVTLLPHRSERAVSAPWEHDGPREDWRFPVPVTWAPERERVTILDAM